MKIVPEQERPPETRAPTEARRRVWVGIALRVVLLVALVLCVVGVLGSESYLVPGGELTLQLRPAWPGGHVIMPLGPAGRVEMATHRTPVDVEVTYALAGRETLGELGALSNEIPAAKSSAESAFASFALTRIPWLAGLGIAAGLLVVGIGPRLRRRLVFGAVGGLLAVGVCAGIFAGVTYATLDRTPSVAYYGLAKDLPRAVSAVGSVSSSIKDHKLGFGEFVGALETISRQLQAGTASAAPDGDTVRLLFASDEHLNPVGARLTRQLADSPTTPIAALVLGGDMTYFGTQPEARLFATELGRIDVPVIAVGGNHDSAPAMDYFRGLKWRVLDDGIAAVDGVRILGFADPTAATSQLVSTSAQLEEAAARAASAYAAASPPPDILLVHDVAQAQQVIAAARRAGTPLLVLHGHDHVLRVTRKGSVTIIDGGTAGASGVEKLGTAPYTPYTFQVIEFVRRAGVLKAASVTSLSYAGDGSSAATYQPISP